MLDIAEISRIAASFHCDTRSAFLTNSRLLILVIRVKIVIQKVGKDSEQNFVGCLLNLKLIGEFYTVLKAKVDCQYRGTHDMQWAKERRRSELAKSSVATVFD